MKRILCLVAVCALFCCCEDKNTNMTIQGELRTDRNFDGELIYMMPAENKGGNPLEKDSAIVKDGLFIIDKKVDTTYIAVIRAKNPILSYFLQPLLVAVEPGRLTVRLDSVSHAKGTPLNDVLQTWKEHKTSPEAQLAEHENDFSDYNYNFVKENKDNPVGKFVYSVTKYLFTEEQQKTLNMP